MKLALIALVVLMLAGTAMADWRTYRQVVELTFASPPEAEEAQLKALPMPLGKRIAFSTRWDDTFPHGEKVDVLSANGYRGTFYLGAPQAALMQKILDNGGSVGAHTVSHPHLPQMSPNVIFKEILANRIALEAAGDTCVVAFTLPFMEYQSPTDPDMPRRISDCLVRSGLLGGPEVWPDSASRFRLEPKRWVGALTFDINDTDPQLELFQQRVQAGLRAIEAGELECGPHLTLGIHSWQGEAMARFGEIIATQADRPDWWYCNDNEYVAYRIQALNTVITKSKVSGMTATFLVDRIRPSELGDRISMTMRASVPPTSVKVDGHTTEVIDGSAFLLRHDASQQLPSRVAAVSNAGNRPVADAAASDPAVPGLKLALQVLPAKNALVCYLKNASTSEIKDLQLTFRIPPKWKVGIIQKDIAALRASEEVSYEIPLGAQESDGRYGEGSPYFAMQCDVVDEQGPARVYATVELIKP